MNEKKLELLIENGPSAGRRFSVGASGVRVGRSSSNDVVIADEELSRNHCMFEVSGEKSIRLIDLASANGTFVNGDQVGADPVDLFSGDLIALGATCIRVVGEGEQPETATKKPAAAPDAKVDLGLGASVQPADAAPAASPAGRLAGRRAPFIYILWAVALSFFVVAVWLVARTYLNQPEPVGAGGEGVVKSLGDSDRIVEMTYEKVTADSHGIFRFALALSSDGTLRANVDDVPQANRHIDKSEKLGDKALARVREILTDRDFLALDGVFAGPKEEPPKLERYAIRIVFGGQVRSVRVINTSEPEAFRQMREKLETFAMNELHILALQYSTDKLVEMSEASAETAQTKWNDRDSANGNLFEAIRAWNAAMVYLETVSPKPEAFEEYRKSRETAEEELQKRFADHRFLADRAIKLGDWATAAAELKILCELVPDREDERHREVAAKLVDVENRLRKGGVK